MTIEEMRARFMDSWPDRVLLNDLRSVPVRRSEIRPDFVFIRDDGWSLGVEVEHLGDALSLWLSEWVQVLDVHASKLYPIWEFLSTKYPVEFERFRAALEYLYKESARFGVRVEGLADSMRLSWEVGETRIPCRDLPANWVKFGYLAGRSDLKPFPVDYALYRNEPVFIYYDPVAGWFGKRVKSGMTTQPFVELMGLTEALVNNSEVEWHE